MTFDAFARDCAQFSTSFGDVESVTYRQVTSGGVVTDVSITCVVDREAELSGLVLPVDGAPAVVYVAKDDLTTITPRRGDLVITSSETDGLRVRGIESQPGMWVLNCAR